MAWFQYTLRLPAKSRGFHLITPDILEVAKDLPRVRIGLLHIFLQHTSASITINENADPDVAADLESSFNHIAAESFPYVHTVEGPDDMPAHVKAALIGSGVTIPVSGGKLALGIWQGVYLCEHRNRASRRNLVLTLWGDDG